VTTLVAAQARIAEISPRRMLATFVVLQWALVLGLAATVRHAGWIFYQGGDQLWYFTVGWALAHGHLVPPGVGYLWSALLAPLGLAAGPNIADAYPLIIVLQFLFFLPAALLCVYGIARRFGGQLFAYWTAAVWLLVPLVGIRFTNPGYHQRFTEATLPQAFGLTAMADFPSMVAAIVAVYFAVRYVVDDRADWVDAAAAGVAAGAAFAIKPATALFLVGPILLFAVARRFRGLAYFVAALAPAAIVLAFVKWRGFGHLPILNAEGVRTASGSALVVVGGVGTYLPFDWHQFVTHLDQIREHFWSVRVVEWLVIGGTIAAFRRSLLFGTLVAGWFFPLVLIKGGSGRADFEGGGLLRLLMPAYPAFVLMIAALPFLVPRLSRRAGAGITEAPRLEAPRRVAVLAAALFVTVLAPFAAYAVASPSADLERPVVGFLQGPPIPLNVDMGLSASRDREHVRLRWNEQHARGGPLFYHVFRRAPATPLCFHATGSIGPAPRCDLQLTDLGTTRNPTFVDRAAPAGAVYYVGAAANWVDDPAEGDVYVVSAPAAAP
jgi:hypothetical protein